MISLSGMGRLSKYWPSLQFWNFHKKSVKLLSLMLLVASPVESASSIRQLTNFEGLETVFYSQDSGKAYLSLNYSKAELDHPKIGFLNFGMAFLQVKDMNARLDLRYAKPDELFSKWNNLITQKAIRYATLEPVTIEFIDKSGNACLLKAEKGKLNSAGKLLLLGNATIEYLETKKLFSRLTIDLDDSKNCLVIEKTKSEKLILLIN